MASHAASIAPDPGRPAAAGTSGGASLTRGAVGANASAGAVLGLAALGWMGGVGLQLQERALMSAPSYAALLGCGFTLAVSAARAARRRSTRCFPARGAGVGAGMTWPLLLALALAVGSAALAFAATGLRALDRLADVLPAALEGRDLRVTGVVASLPSRGPSGLRFRFEPESAALAGQPVGLPRQLSLGWYGGFHEDAVLTQPQTELAAGQRWQFTLRLRQPHGNLNPHGFDGELYLFEQGVRAVGYVRDSPSPRRVEHAAAHPIERWRQRVRDAIDARVADPRTAGVLAALAVGDQSAIGRDDWALFRDTGIAHLVSISGLHVTMFAWLAGAVITASWRRSRRATLWLPAQTAGAWGGLAAALAYALLSGFGVPSQRTVWMLAVVTVLRCGGRRWPWPLALLAAAVAVTAFDPWALLQAGFWLSFMAVGLLMASSGGTARAGSSAGAPGAAARSASDSGGDIGSPPAGGDWRSRLGGWRRTALAALHGGLRTQLIATLGLAPLTLVFFQQLSLVGFFANLAAIPVITLLVTPLALLGTLAWPLWALGGWAIRCLTGLLQWLQGWPGAVWWAPAAPWWAQLAALAGAALLMAPLPWRLRALALPMVLPLLLPPLDRPAEGGFELVAVDVGQGTAVLVRTRRHLLVYDSGPRYSRDGNAGERVLLPLLRVRGEAAIDRLVLSHRDDDHTGGAAALLQGMPVAALSSSLEPGHPLLLRAADRGIPLERCTAGQRWRWDGVDFAVLAPPPVAGGGPPLRSNALSCVLRISAGPAGASALLTGDIEQAQEAALVAGQAAALRSDVLLVPHHGSRTSSTAGFIDAVAPGVAVFQTGYRNRFGHPAPEVLARYAGRGVAAVASPDCGAWQWRSGSSAGDAPFSAGRPAERNVGVCERDRVRRYWHHAVPRAAAS